MSKSIGDLPGEMIIEILKQSDLEDIFNLCATNKKIRDSCRKINIKARYPDFIDRIFKIVKYGNAFTLTSILKFGIPPDIKNADGQTLLNSIMRYAYPYSIEKMEILLSNRADPNNPDDEGITPLVNLLEGINNNLRGIKQKLEGEEERFQIALDKLRTILKYGADPNLPVKENNKKIYPLKYILYTPLSIKVANILLDYGADPNLGEIFNNGVLITPLMDLVLKPDLLEIYLPELISRGAEINFKNIAEDTALSILIENVTNDYKFSKEDLPRVKILLDHGADPSLGRIHITQSFLRELIGPFKSGEGFILYTPIDYVQFLVDCDLSSYQELLSLLMKYL